MTRVHIVSSARNAGPWLDAQLASLAAQTHADWVLHIRDDGSTDDTWEVIERWRRREPRLATAVRGSASLGSAQGFAEMLRQVPADASVIATADADDVWLPQKLELTLRALADAERAAGGPILVHSDVRVVDAALREIAPSFWRASGMTVDAPTPQMVAIENVAIGPTQLFNRELLGHVTSMPPEAIHQDWWIALVASVRGRLVALHEPTVLYRRHAHNTTTNRVGARAHLHRLANALHAIPQLRSQLDQTSRQAAALLRDHGAALTPRDREALAALAQVAVTHGIARRKAIIRGRWHSRHGLVQNLGVVLRG